MVDIPYKMEEGAGRILPVGKSRHTSIVHFVTDFIQQTGVAFFVVGQLFSLSFTAGGDEDDFFQFVHNLRSIRNFYLSRG